MSNDAAYSLEATTRDAPAPADVDMAGAEVAEVEEPLEIPYGDEEAAEKEEETGSEEETPPSPTFVDYLQSPIIEIAVGIAPTQTLLTAHQALLIQSPFFATAIAAFSSATTRRIGFPDEDLDSVGAFLQFLYTQEYFPRKLGEALEPVPSAAADGGEQLLRHARVYTLAEKLQMPALKQLAHSKVHRVDSTAAGEISYAKYVYANTPTGDEAIRRPIASFWGQRSHVLRHEAEGEFRDLCIEYPEFGFDVLSYVLDARERKSMGHAEEVQKSGRKRARNI